VGCLIGTPGFATAAAGGALITFGCILHLWSKGCLEQNRRLITAGPYRFSRNPFYLANLFIDLGTCFVIGQIWVGIIYLVLWALAYRDTIEGEEAKLAALFPGQFERYVSFVPRLFPNGGVFPAADVTGHFSFRNWCSRSIALRGTQAVRSRCVYGTCMHPRTARLLGIETRAQRDVQTSGESVVAGWKFVGWGSDCGHRFGGVGGLSFYARALVVCCPWTLVSHRWTRSLARDPG